MDSVAEIIGRMWGAGQFDGGHAMANGKRNFAGERSGVISNDDTADDVARMVGKQFDEAEASRPR